MNGDVIMKNILVLLPHLEARHKEKLEKAGQGCSFTYSLPDQVTADAVRSAEIIIGLPRPLMVGASGKLEWLQLATAGADVYVRPGVLSPKTILTNAVGAYGKSVGEHAFAVTLMLLKKLYLYRDDQADCKWGDHGQVRSLGDCTVLVVGLGNIGSYYARLVKAMGAKVIGVRRQKAACPEYVDELVQIQDLDLVLPKADVIMSVLPATEATRHMYTPERFEMMKDSAVFINCGRGSAVSSEDLYHALEDCQIAAASIDVTETEPLPKDSKLWGLKNLVITPHISGGYHLPETLDRIVDIAAGNLSAYLDGKELVNVVER